MPKSSTFTKALGPARVADHDEVAGLDVAVRDVARVGTSRSATAAGSRKRQHLDHADAAVRQARLSSRSSTEIERLAVEPLHHDVGDPLAVRSS
jgi:hypothetical protein